MALLAYRKKLLEDLRVLDMKIEEANELENDTARDILLRDLRHNRYQIRQDLGSITVDQAYNDYTFEYDGEQAGERVRKEKASKVIIDETDLNTIILEEKEKPKYFRALTMCQSYRKSINTTSTEIEDLLKLTNLAENYNVSELIDSCLSKNKKKTINILNENNYSLEDCILIIRTFLIKSKRLIRLKKQLQLTKDIDSIISTFKPPIFWKDKEIVKQQVRNWSYKGAQNLSYEINEVELLIKKHSNNAINILSNFIIEKASVINN